MPIPAITTAHNAEIAGDTLGTIQLNYKWRRLLVELLSPLCFDSYWAGSASDVETSVNNAHSLIDDIYTFEDVGVDYSYAQKTHVYTSNQSTSSTTFAVIDSTNLRITVMPSATDHPILYGFSGAFNVTATYAGYVGVFLNGDSLGDSTYGQVAVVTQTVSRFSYTGYFLASEVSEMQLDLRWRTSSGSASLALLSTGGYTTTTKLWAVAL